VKDEEERFDRDKTHTGEHDCMQYGPDPV